MAKQLITQRRFLPYFCTQFLGAFNDNVYRYAFAILITYFLAKENQGVIVNAALVAFILPFFVFGAIAGQLADKYEKAWLIRQIKVAEIVIMLLGCAALYFQSVYGMLAILFALGSQSAFFGPIKYSILPQHVRRDELVGANAYVEAGTFIAILLGQILGGALGANLDYQLMLMLSIVGFAVLGRITAGYIPDAPAAAPDLKLSLNIFKKTSEIIRMSYQNRPVFKSILAISWFWFVGSIILTMFPIYAVDVLNGDPSVAIFLLATFTIGIALGSFACSLISGKLIELGLVPLGGFGISWFVWSLAETSIPQSSELRDLSAVIAVDGGMLAIFYLIMVAFFSGLFIVPLYTYMQANSAESQRSRFVAVNNILNSVFMVVAGGLGMVLLQQQWTVLEVFQLLAVLNLLVTLFIISHIPEYFLRFIALILLRIFYRVEKRGFENFPHHEPLLLVSNHVSFFDSTILLASLPRPVRFVIWHEYYDLPVIGRLFKWLKTIPIGTMRSRPELIEDAFNRVDHEFEQGRLVLIFPEGGITQDGEIRRFQPGVDQILKRNPITVVPLALQGLWGTWSSRAKGRAFTGLPKGIRPTIRIVAGEPLSAEDANRKTLYEAVTTLRGDER